MQYLLRLLYVSKARLGLDEDDLAAILTVARAHNREVGISGALCLRAGYFAQVLEGPELPVLEIYVKLARDERHSDPVLIAVETTDRRIYDGWFMASITDDEQAFVDSAELLALRKSAGDQDGAPMLMQRWLTLLNARAESSPRAASPGT